VRRLALLFLVLSACKPQLFRAIPPEPDASADATVDASVAKDAADSTDAARVEADAEPGDAEPTDAEPADAEAPDAIANDDAGPDPFSTDPALFYGAARCNTANVLFCEDFETSTIGQPPDPSVWETNDPNITVGTDQFARGARALHVIAGSIESLHFIRTTQIAPMLERQMWGRVFFRVEGPRPAAFNHWTVAEATGIVPEGGTGRIRYGGIRDPGANNRFIFNYDIWGGQPAGFHEVAVGDNLDVPDQTWHCIEWLFDVDARQVRFFHDAVELPALGAMTSIDGIDLAFPSMDGLNIGWATYQDIGTDTWDVWIDSIAADSQRIGCVR
jgi:hypothetical protein